MIKHLLTFIGAATLSLFLATSASAHPATGIVVDRAGNVYFSDLETIWKVGTDGKLTVFRAAQRGRHVHELAIDGADNIYGGDVSYNPTTEGWPSAIWKMTPEGKTSYLLESTETPPRAMSIWLDRAGNSYWIDQNNHTKTQTLLLKRTPEGVVMTLAGSSYGHSDGKGSEAKFSNVGGMAFGPDGSLYLSDGASIRKITMEGIVTTIGSGLDFRNRKDQPRFLSGLSGSLTGLTVAPDGTVYAADSGNRRLLKVTLEGKVEAILRTEPPFFPNGVAISGNDLYVLEVGFTLPNISSGPRVRKISADGKQTILATVGGAGSETGKRPFALSAGVTAEKALVLVSEDGRWRYTLAVLSFGVLSIVIFIWRTKQRGKRRASA